MEGPGFDDPRSYGERELHDRAHELEHAMKRIERDMKHAERERMHAIKDAMKNLGMPYVGIQGQAAAGPRTVEEVLVEIDSYLSYLEDLPEERLAPYENQVDNIAGHLEKVRSSLKK